MLNPGKPHVLLVGGIDTAVLPEDKQEVLKETQLTEAQGGMRVLGTPIDRALPESVMHEMSSNEPTVLP